MHNLTHNRIFVKTIFISLLSFLYVHASAQSDSVFTAASIKNTIDRYNQAFSKQSLIYNGSEYKEPKQTNDLHPFFVTTDWQYGNIEYNGEYFEDIAMLYDLTSDQIVTEYYNGDQIALLNEKIKSFSIGQHYFINLVKDSTTHGLPETGFYQVLHNKKTQLLQRRKKTIQERIEGKEIEVDFEDKRRFFIFKEGTYYPVKTKSSVLKVLSDQKPALKKYIAANKISFSKNREASLTSTVAYYDTLIKNQE